jgi:hypothetical protein
MTADGTSFSTAMSALANDRAVTTRAPAPANASAMPNAIKGSSSQTRIERPAKLVLFMFGIPWRGKAPNCQRQERPLMGRAVSRVVDQSSMAQQA